MDRLTGDKGVQDMGMKEYDPNIEYGIHTVKITLQQWEYIGHIIERIRGNCRGKSVLDFDFEEFEEDFDLGNDCEMKCDDGWFSCVLHDEKGNELEVDGDASEMNELIVGMEIIDFKEQKNIVEGGEPHEE